MNRLTFILLESTEDEDLGIIKEGYCNPLVERFISIDNENYWSYVTKSENVYFYKLYNEDNPVGTVHCEVYDGILYLSLVVFIQYQNRKIGSDAIKCVIEGITGLDFKEIQVSVDEKNTASMRLFQNAGFNKIGQKDELVDLQYIM